MKEIITEEHYDDGFGGIYTRLYFDENRYNIDCVFDKKCPKYIISDKNKNVLGIIEENGVTTINQVYTTDGRSKFLVYISSPRYSLIEGEALYYDQIPTHKIQVYEIKNNELVYETEFKLSNVQFLKYLKNLEDYESNEIIFGISSSNGNIERFYSIDNGYSPKYDQVLTNKHWHNGLDGILNDNIAFVQKTIERKRYVYGIDKRYTELIDIYSYLIDLNTFEARSSVYVQSLHKYFDIYTEEELKNGVIEKGRTERLLNELEECLYKDVNISYNDFYGIDDIKEKVVIKKELIKKLIR